MTKQAIFIDEILPSRKLQMPQTGNGLDLTFYETPGTAARVDPVWIEPGKFHMNSATISLRRRSLIVMDGWAGRGLPANLLQKAGLCKCGYKLYWLFSFH
jgi:hypothetical protein